jgi:hypothetical protein
MTDARRKEHGMDTQDGPTVEDFTERIREAEEAQQWAAVIGLIQARHELVQSQRVIEEPVPVDHVALNARYRDALGRGDLQALIQIEMERARVSER